jgi:hypothetical protein
LPRYGFSGATREFAANFRAETFETLGAARLAVFAFIKPRIRDLVDLAGRALVAGLGVGELALPGVDEIAITRKSEIFRAIRFVASIPIFRTSAARLDAEPLPSNALSASSRCAAIAAASAGLSAIAHRTELSAIHESKVSAVHAPSPNALMACGKKSFGERSLCSGESGFVR